MQSAILKDFETYFYKQARQIQYPVHIIAETHFHSKH